LKKVSIYSAHETTVSKTAVFSQELALAKPVAHDEFSFGQFFNGLLKMPTISETPEDRDAGQVGNPNESKPPPDSSG